LDDNTSFRFLMSGQKKKSKTANYHISGTTTATICVCMLCCSACTYAYMHTIYLLHSI
jgi:hypothetical protein